MVLANLQANALLAQSIVRLAVERIGTVRPPSDSHQALRHALITPAQAVPAATRRRLDLFTTPYWGPFDDKPAPSPV